MRLFLLAAAAGATLAAAPQVSAQTRPGEERVNALIVYGQDPCPRGQGDEIVVCARKPESERYRIPENLRSDPNNPANQAWANRAQSLEYAGRSGIGSCSPVGAGGWTGCFNQLVREARAERGQTDVNMVRLIEAERAARAERLENESAAGSQQPQAPLTPK
jgi:hypothetical protein